MIIIALTNFGVTYFLEMKHDVELTNIAEVFVQCLHKQVDELKVGQLVVWNVTSYREEESRIPAIYQLVGLELKCSKSGIKKVDKVIENRWQKLCKLTNLKNWNATESGTKKVKLWRQMTKRVS